MMDVIESARTDFDDNYSGATASRLGDTTPFDRLSGPFFNAPPRGSLYHTQRAQYARQRGAAVVPQSCVEKSQQALNDVLTRRYAVSDCADHNIMTLAYALHYADQGMPVIDGGGFFDDGTPCGADNGPKTPRGARWAERGTTDHAQLCAYWRGEGQYPANSKGDVHEVAAASLPRNLCFVVPTGHMVVDLDGATGDASFTRLIEENGELPPTWTSVTGSGGKHFVFKVKKAVRNSASAVGDKIDIRGVGGQIVVEPSLHKSGGFYRWEDGRAPWECAVADAPDWLENLAFEASKSRKSFKAKKKGRSDQMPQGQGGLGFDGYLESIGDHDGGAGFDAPILSAANAWFAANGADADSYELFDILQERILEAECDDDRNVARYATDDYLDERIEQARAFIENVEEEHADLPEVPDTFEPVKGWLPKGYKVRGETIYLKGEERETPLCQLFNVVGRAANENAQSGAGVIIQFTNRNGVDVELTLDRSDLMKDSGGAIIDTLADADMLIYVRDKKGKGHLLDLLHRISPERLITTIKRPGWVRDRAGEITGFLCPSGEFVAVNNASQRRLHSDATIKDTQPLGTMEGWQQAASAAPANFHWALGVAAGFAGPVMGLLGMRPCGLYLTGASSKGKTTASYLAVSAWGSPLPKQGTFFSLNTTANAVEDLAVTGSETALALDELGAMQNPAALASMLFSLESGASKARKKGYGPEDVEFAPFTLLTYERGLREFIHSANSTYNDGLSVRFPSVNVSEGMDVDQDVIDELNKCKSNFGHAGPEFVRWLIGAGHVADPAQIKERHSDLTKQIAGKMAGAQLKRAAQAFALVALSGELASEAGLIDFEVLPHVIAAFGTFCATDEARAFTGGGGAVDSFRSFVGKQMGVGIVQAVDAEAERSRAVIGWQTDTHYILNWEALSDPRRYDILCTRIELVKALKEIDAVEMQGKNNFWKSLPDEVGLGKLNNLRIFRDKLGM